MRCPKCNTENRDGAKFCDECGYELTAASIAVPEDDFASTFTESGTVKLTHIAEKLRKPESADPLAALSDDQEDLLGISGDTGGVVFLADEPDALADDRMLADDPGQSAFAYAQELHPDAAEYEEATGYEEALGSFDAPLEALGQDEESADTEKLSGDAFIDDLEESDDEPYAPFSAEELDSVNTAPLSVAAVDHAIREDDQSTLLANAARTARLQAQRVPAESVASAYDMPPIIPESQVPDDAHSFLAFSSNRGSRFGKRFKMGLIISLCVIAALIAILGITYALQIWGGKTIPNVMGTSSADAKYLLEESGFIVEEKPIVSDDVEGIVIEVWPEQGSRQPLGSVVTIGVSVFRAIPDIIGVSYDEAKALLDEYGYTDIELVMKKSDEEENTILAVSPTVGTRAPADTHVAIEVAQPYIVPNVVGEYKDTAVGILKNEGFSADIKYDYSDASPEGTILRTVPAAGDPCKTTTPVQIFVAISRATELGDLTSALFSGVETLTYGGNRYQYVKGSFATASCPDNNTCNFTIRARLLDSHTWPDGRTDTWVGDEVTISSTAGWSDNNEFLYMDPNLLG